MYTMATNKPKPLNRKASNFEMDRIGGAQMHGILLKKPVGHKSTTWSRRFFVLKEGFLLYYAETEKKAFADKSTFNIHPKGIIPLGYCTIEEISLPGVNYGISVTYPDGTNVISLGAESDDIRRRWVTAMDTATKVTLENCDLGDSMIKSLQEQTLQLAIEKQEYYQKFMRGEQEICVEREQREVLEQFNLELEEEKARIETLVNELQDAQDEIRRELEETTEACLILENDRESMINSTKKLQNSIAELSAERAIITKRLVDYESSDNSDGLDALREELERISDSAGTLEQEKNEMEQKLKENEKKLLEVANEKRNQSADVDELKSEIQQLNKEKENVETELKEEISIRVELQQQLKECKEALMRLELEVQVPQEYLTSQDIQSMEKQKQINKDVKSLRSFFDNVAVENQLESRNVDLTKRKFSRRFTQIKKLRESNPLMSNLEENSLRVPDNGFLDLPSDLTNPTPAKRALSRISED